MPFTPIAIIDDLQDPSTRAKTYLGLTLTHGDTHGLITTFQPLTDDAAVIAYIHTFRNAPAQHSLARPPQSFSRRWRKA